MKKCVFGCDTTGVRLHSFPNPNQQPKLIRKWLEVLTISQDINKHIKTFLQKSDPITLHICNYKVCDHHFKREHKTHSGHVIYGAVPSINLQTTPIHPSETLPCLMEHNYSSEKEVTSKLSTDKMQTPSNKPLESPPAKPFRFIFMDDEDIVKGNTDDANVDKTTLVLLKKVNDESELNTDNLSTKNIVNSKQYKGIKKANCKEIAIVQPAKEDISNTDIVKRKTNVAIVDKHKLFSWQKDSEIVCDELNKDNLSSTKETDNKQNPSVNKDKCKENIPNTDTPLYSDKDLHQGYKCDMCKGPIYMFRYACVQCVNFDLCGACEGHTAHAHHYLLRVPGPKPYAEVQQLIDTMKKILAANIKSLQSRAVFINNLLENIKSEVVYDVGSDPLSEEPDYSFKSVDEHEKLKMDNNTSSPSVKTTKTSVSPKVIPNPIDIRERRKDREKHNNTSATPQKSIRRVVINVDKHIPCHTEQAKMDIGHSFTSLPTTAATSTEPVGVKDVINDDSQATTTPHTEEPIDVDDDIIWLDEELLEENEILHRRCDDTNNIVTKQIENNDAGNNFVNTNEKPFIPRILNKSYNNAGNNLVNTNEKPFIPRVLNKSNNNAGNNLVNTNEKPSIPKILNKSYDRSSSNAHGKVSKTLVLTLSKKVSNIGSNTSTLNTQKMLKTIKHSLESKVSIQVKRLSKEEIAFATKTGN